MSSLIDQSRIFGMPRPLFRCLLLVNGLWIAYLALAMTVLPHPFLDPNGSLRSLIRVAILLLPTYYCLARYEEKPWWDALQLRQNFRNGVLVGIVASAVWFLIQLTRFQVSLQFRTHPFGNPAIWINLIIGSPFAEEFLYRGLVYRTLSKTTSRVQAGLVSALWFALLHLPWWIVTRPLVPVLWSLLTIFIYGLVFAALFEKAKSLWGSIIPHSVNNLLFTVLPRR